MPVLHKLTNDERAEIDALVKAHKASTDAKNAAEKQLADDATLINAFVVRIKRKYKLLDTDQLRLDGVYDIFRLDDGVTPPGEPAPPLALVDTDKDGSP